MMPKVTKIEANTPVARLKRVAAYARVSCSKEAMLHSLEAQVSQYSRLIQSHNGWQYMGVYADEAITGTKESRAEFQRLLTDCRAGKIDMILPDRDQGYPAAKNVQRGDVHPSPEI